MDQWNGVKFLFVLLFSLMGGKMGFLPKVELKPKILGNSESPGACAAFYNYMASYQLQGGFSLSKNVKGSKKVKNQFSPPQNGVSTDPALKFCVSAKNWHGLLQLL